MTNAQTVEEIYAAFGRGDVPAILDKMADDVDWDYAYAASPCPVPYLQPRKGKNGVAEFLRLLVENVTITGFAVKAVLEAPSLVVGIVDVAGTVKSTGKSWSEVDEAHVWHFNAHGKVARFRHSADTWQHVMAFQASA